MKVDIRAKSEGQEGQDTKAGYKCREEKNGPRVHETKENFETSII